MNTFYDELRNLGYRLMHTAVKEINTFYTSIAKKTEPILITGESGTGKEMFAKAFHRVSGRKGGLVSINCGGITDPLLQADLFGYVKGAFSGALKDTLGKIQRAAGGTLFLDEIGDAPPSVQVALLRFLNDGSFYRVGDTKEQKVDVRIIAATNKNLHEEIKAGRFREDLYYRLNAFSINTDTLLKDNNQKYQVIEWTLGELSKGGQGKTITEDNFLYPDMVKLIRAGKKPFTPEAEAVLLRYPFPGNYRELKNILKYSLVKCYARIQDSKKKNHIITLDDLHPDVFTKIKREDNILDTPPEKFLPKINELFMQKYEMLIKEGMSKSEIAKRLGLKHQNRLKTLTDRSGLVDLKKT